MEKEMELKANWRIRPVKWEKGMQDQEGKLKLQYKPGKVSDRLTWSLEQRFLVRGSCNRQRWSGTGTTVLFNHWLGTPEKSLTPLESWGRQEVQLGNLHTQQWCLSWKDSLSSLKPDWCRQQLSVPYTCRVCMLAQSKAWGGARERTWRACAGLRILDLIPSAVRVAGKF